MKMLFHNGSIAENTEKLGIGKINFSTNGMDVLDAFSKSLWYISGLLGIYDIEHYRKIKDKDIFFFYHTQAENEKEYRPADKQSIITELDAIMSGSINNIANWEDTMIKEAAEGTELNAAMGINNGHKVYVNETIYWDTINHFIVVIGKEQLRELAHAFLEEKYKDAFRIYEGLTREDFLSEFVTEENMPKALKQILSLSK